MNNKFDINIHCIVFAVNIAENKRYILSINEEEIVFPKIEADKDLIKNPVASIQKFVQSHVFVNILELIPQLVSLHEPVLNTSEDSIDAVYGFIIDHSMSLNNCYWIEFDFMKPNKYSDLLFYTAQQLQ